MIDWRKTRLLAKVNEQMLEYLFVLNVNYSFVYNLCFPANCLHFVDWTHSFYKNPCFVNPECKNCKNKHTAIMGVVVDVI